MNCGHALAPLLTALIAGGPVPAGAAVERLGGGGRGDGGLCSEAILEPSGFTIRAGQLYVGDTKGHEVRRMTPLASSDCHVFRVAGTSQQGFAGDGGLAIAARLNGPFDVAVAADGVIYFTDSGNARIRAVLNNGQIVTVAGGSYLNPFGLPTGIDIGADGWVYVADGDPNVNRVWRIEPWPCAGACDVTVFAGTGAHGFAGDNGPAASALLRAPRDVRWRAGTAYIADTGNQRIRQVDLAGIIRTVVGSGGPSGTFAGDGLPATSARLNTPSQIDFAGDGSLYIADTDNNRIRRVRPDGIIETALGTGAVNTTGSFSPDPLALAISRPLGVAAEGDLVIVGSEDDRVLYALRQNAATPTVTRVATVTRTPTRTASATATATSSATASRTASLIATSTATRTVAITTPTLTPTLPPILTCDVTLNGTISALDAAWILQAVAGTRTFIDRQRTAADATGDGTVSALDATRILQFTAGLRPPAVPANRCGLLVPAA